MRIRTKTTILFLFLSLVPLVVIGTEITLWIGVLVALTVIVISLAIARSITHPILKMAQVAARVSQGSFDEKVNYHSNDEIGSLARTFDQMVVDLKKQRAQLVLQSPVLLQLTEEDPGIVGPAWPGRRASSSRR